MAQREFAALRRNILHYRCRIDNSADLSYIRGMMRRRAAGPQRR